MHERETYDAATPPFKTPGAFPSMQSQSSFDVHDESFGEWSATKKHTPTDLRMNVGFDATTRDGFARAHGLTPVATGEDSARTSPEDSSKSSGYGHGGGVTPCANPVCTPDASSETTSGAGPNATCSPADLPAAPPPVVVSPSSTFATTPGRDDEDRENDECVVTTKRADAFARRRPRGPDGGGNANATPTRASRMQLQTAAAAVEAGYDGVRRSVKTPEGDEWVTTEDIRAVVKAVPTGDVARAYLMGQRDAIEAALSDALPRREVLGKFEEKTDACAAAVAALTAELGALRSSVHAVDARTGSLEKNVSALAHGTVPSLERAHGELIARVDEMEYKQSGKTVLSLCDELGAAAVRASINNASRIDRIAGDVAKRVLHVGPEGGAEGGATSDAATSDAAFDARRAVAVAFVLAATELGFRAHRASIRRAPGAIRAAAGPLTLAANVARVGLWASAGCVAVAKGKERCYAAADAVVTACEGSKTFRRVAESARAAAAATTAALTTLGARARATLEEGEGEGEGDGDGVGDANDDGGKEGGFGTPVADASRSPAEVKMRFFAS